MTILSGTEELKKYLMSLKEEDLRNFVGLKNILLECNQNESNSIEKAKIKNLLLKLYPKSLVL